MDAASEHRHRQGMCNTSGCLWLQEYLNRGGRGSGSGHIHSQSQRGGRPGPCDDFHEHVCGSRRHSLYRDGVARLMAAVAERITGRLRVVPGSGSGRVEAVGAGDPEENHAIVLDRCLAGEAVVCGERMSEGCPSMLPDAPLGISERFFRVNNSATIDDYAAYVQSLAQDIPTGDSLNINYDSRVKAFPRRWMSTACSWVELSARCHFERSLRMRDHGRLSLYQQLWKIIYFAPFMGSQARPLVKAAYEEPPDPLLQACLRIIDDVFPHKTVQAAKATLSETVDGLHDTIAHFVWEARQASGRGTGLAGKIISASPLLVMRALAPEWLAQGAVNGTASVSDDFRQRRVVRELAAQQLIAIEALVDDGSSTTRTDASIYSWQASANPHKATLVRYLEDRKALLLPLGLLGLFVNSMSTVEPVLVPLLGRPVLRELMPARHGPYSWRHHNEQRLQAIVDCVAAVLDVAGAGQAAARALATEVTLESGALQPLLALYDRRLHEEHTRGIRLHSDYSNAELFFVLWALGHCGERNAAIVVNGALRNFAPFSRAFQCAVNQAMWTGHRCPFWH
ncbi:hypothetical protein HPB50_018949 [Hyalomma asiaticum]|uniref:Uncharacterized protein n=1 Tax=Hyalomma asiaticum TaxID=266040 RepID=A0ACB7RRZ7_HYAAI|nr:hypothetical protein HPB50_018949 [Hyalomma asiaticum]